MRKQLAGTRWSRLELRDDGFRNSGVELAAKIDERVAQAEHGAEPKRVASDPLPVERGAACLQDGERVGEPEDVRGHGRTRACEAEPNQFVARGQHARACLAERDLERLVP